jgi:hypothetical protein
MVFEYLKKIAVAQNFKCENVMTPWDRVVRNDILQEFDYIPFTNDGEVLNVFCRMESEYINKPELAKFIIEPESHLIDMISKMEKNYTENYKSLRPSFLIVGTLNSPMGIVTHADLNKAEVALTLWQIYYEFEKKMTNKLSNEIIKDRELEMKITAIVENKKYYKNKIKNNIELEKVTFLTIDEKMKRLKLKGINKKFINKFRNRIAHPSNKINIIEKKSDLQDLVLTLKDMEYQLRNIY